MAPWAVKLHGEALYKTVDRWTQIWLWRKEFWQEVDVINLSADD